MFSNRCLTPVSAKMRAISSTRAWPLVSVAITASLSVDCSTFGSRPWEASEMPVRASRIVFMYSMTGMAWAPTNGSSIGIIMPGARMRTTLDTSGFSTSSRFTCPSTTPIIGSTACARLFSMSRAMRLLMRWMSPTMS